MKKPSFAGILTQRMPSTQDRTAILKALIAKLNQSPTETATVRWQRKRTKENGDIHVYSICVRKRGALSTLFAQFGLHGPPRYQIYWSEQILSFWCKKTDCHLIDTVLAPFKQKIAVGERWEGEIEK